MEEVQGDAAFESFPGESFRFGVGSVDGEGTIWLEALTSKKKWTCTVKDVAAFAPADVALPRDMVLRCVAASLKKSVAAPSNVALGPKLLRKDEDKTLQLEVLIKMGVVDVAWVPKYTFPMALMPRLPKPVEMQSAEKIRVLTARR